MDFSTLSNSNTTNSFTGDLLIVETSSGTYANAYKDITSIYKDNANKVLRFDFESITSEVTPTIRIVGLRVVDNRNSNKLHISRQQQSNNYAHNTSKHNKHNKCIPNNLRKQHRNSNNKHSHNKKTDITLWSYSRKL